MTGVLSKLALGLLLAAISLGGCQCGGAQTAAPPTLLSMGTPKAPAPAPPRAESPDVERLQGVIAKLEPLHAAKRVPRENDWLAHHGEPGQTFDAYRQEHPVVPDLDRGPGKRHTLYIQPLGELNPTQQKIVAHTARYMHRFFGVPVKLHEKLPLSLVPAKARRMKGKTEQILTSHILDEVLRPRLPDDAAAYISFTAADLWPGRGWNFVFGQASLTERVGVWSVHRYGNPDASEAAYRLALLRTLKVAVHETGHMFGMKHCTAHECVMGGSNNLDETDRAPVWLCPQCLAKMSWATRADPLPRYRTLAAFAREHGFVDEASFFQRSIAALESPDAQREPQ